MTQEQKVLLFKDLCARLPYSVKVQVDLQSNTYSPIVCKVCSIECAEIGSAFIGVETSPDTYNEFREFLCKPYLFPLSSMTEEQKYTCPIGVGELEIFIENANWSIMQIMPDSIIPFFDWLHKKHFDYRGLIPMGLAIDATGKNIY